MYCPCPSAAKPIQGEPAARLPHQPHSQQEQARVANQFDAVRRLARGYLTTTTKAAAVNAQAACRSGHHRRHKDHKQYCRRGRDRSGSDPSEQQQAQSDLRKRQTPSHDGCSNW